MMENCGECYRRWYCYIDPRECDKLTDSVSVTNADRIRSMSDEGLAVFLDGFSSRCLECAEDAKNQSCPIYKEGRYCRPQEIMEWLQQPAEEADNG